MAFDLTGLFVGFEPDVYVYGCSSFLSIGSAISKEYRGLLPTPACGESPKPHNQFVYVTSGTGNQTTFSIRAYADRDCDGKLSVVSVTGKIDPMIGEVERSSIKIKNKGE